MPHMPWIRLWKEQGAVRGPQERDLTRRNSPLLHMALEQKRVGPLSGEPFGQVGLDAMSTYILLMPPLGLMLHLPATGTSSHGEPVTISANRVAPA
jgi:hypothetical protein